MKPEVVYSDKLVKITPDCITFYKCSFPFLRPKHVQLSDVDCVEILRGTVETGSARIWGSNDFRTWFPCDLSRSAGDTIFVMSLEDKWMRIGFTVKNPKFVSLALKEVGVRVIG